MANDTFSGAMAMAGSYLGQLVDKDNTFVIGEHQVPVQYAWTLAALLGVASLPSVYKSLLGGDVPHKSGIPFVGSWAFFTKRHRFIQEITQKFGNMVSFNILHVRLCLSFEYSGANVFFLARSLGFKW